MKIHTWFFPRKKSSTSSKKTRKSANLRQVWVEASGWKVWRTNQVRFFSHRFHHPKNLVDATSSLVPDFFFSWICFDCFGAWNKITNIFLPFKMVVEKNADEHHPIKIESVKHHLDSIVTGLASSNGVKLKCRWLEGTQFFLKKYHPKFGEFFQPMIVKSRSLLPPNIALGPRLGGYSSLKNQHGFVSFRECYTLITPNKLCSSKTNQLNTWCLNSSMFGYTQWMIPISLHFWPFDFFLHHFHTKTSNLQNNPQKIDLKKSQKSPPCPPSTPSSFPFFFKQNLQISPQAFTQLPILQSDHPSGSNYGRHCRWHQSFDR